MVINTLKIVYTTILYWNVEARDWEYHQFAGARGCKRGPEAKGSRSKVQRRVYCWQ